LAGQVIDGAWLSFVVTNAVHVDVFPVASDTVKVTVTGVPVLAQSKLNIFKDKVEIAQLSVELLLTIAGVIEASPIVSKVTEIFWQIALGDIKSTTVTT
jgi:hypothetical protein